MREQAQEQTDNQSIPTARSADSSTNEAGATASELSVLPTAPMGGLSSSTSGRGIFCIKSKIGIRKERFSHKASEYLESQRMSIYLQDVIKIILDRKDEKPTDILNEYFSTTMRGEHVLLREFAFVSATAHNRRSFLQ